MIANRFVLAVLCAVMLAISSSGLRAQTVESATEQAERLAQSAAQGGGILDTLERIREAQSQQLEGSWDIFINPVVPPGVPQPATIVSHRTFSRGGGSFGSDRSRPFSKQHGAWEHLGGNRFAFSQTEDLFDAMGNFVGTFVGRVRVTMTNRDELTGVANVESRDASGNVRFNVCATLRGTRIKVEPLPEQCQSITPPQ